MGACPLCGEPVGGGEGQTSLPVHLRRRDCEEVEDLVEAMTPGSMNDVGESSDNRPSTQGKQGTNGTSLSAPGLRCHPGDFTSEYRRSFSTQTPDLEVTKRT